MLFSGQLLKDNRPLGRFFFYYLKKSVDVRNQSGNMLPIETEEAIMKETKRFLKETEEWDKKEVVLFSDTIEIYHGEDSVVLDKEQAKQLLGLIEEFIRE